MEHAIADSLGTRHVVVTGAGGQLGTALCELYPDARVLTRADWDVTFPPPDLGEVDLVLHAAAWTDVDAAEANPQDAAAVNVGGTLNAASLGAPLVAFSTDYVFDGTKRTPYVESDATNPLGVYGRSKLEGENRIRASGCRHLIVRTAWVYGRGSNFVRAILRQAQKGRRVAGG